MTTAGCLRCGHDHEIAHEGYPGDGPQWKAEACKWPLCCALCTAAYNMVCGCEDFDPKNSTDLAELDLERDTFGSLGPMTRAYMREEGF